MKKPVATLTIAGLIASTIATTGALAADQAFKDIDGSFAKEQILELVEKGIIQGVDAESFDPKGTLTRAQFVTLLVRSLNLPIDDTETKFTDVEGWAVPYIEAAFNAGIIKGNGDGTFGPNAPLTREAAVVMMVRGLQTQSDLQLEDADDLDFTDSDSISDWATAYIATAKKLGLISGNPDGSFNPQGTANREQAAVMTFNLVEKVVEVTEPTPTPDPIATPTPSPTPTPPTGGGGYIPPVVTTDTTAPSVPVLDGAETTHNKIIISWTASADNIGVTGYDVFLDGTKVTTVTGLTYTFEGLAPRTQYVVTVKARDAAGNLSAASQHGEFETSAYATNTEELNELLADDSATFIFLADGEYVGQFVIEGNKYLTGEGQNAVIKAPETAIDTFDGFVNHSGANIRPLVYFAPGALGGIGNVTIDGTHAGDVNHPDVISGVGVHNSDSVHIVEVTIKGLIDPDHLGSQNGYGVYVYNTDSRDTEVYVVHNNISHFQKNGIFLNGKIDALVLENTITGFGPHEHNAQNGIVIYGGANADVFGNELSGFQYTGSNNAVATPILNLSDGEVQILGNVVVVPNPEDFVATEDFSYWADSGNGNPAYNVGFNLNENFVNYDDIVAIEVSLVAEDGTALATRMATGTQIEKLAADDLEYGGIDGQLSAAFIERSEGATNDWWTSSAYDFTTPAKVVIKVYMYNDSVYVVENTNLTGLPQ